MVGYFILQSAAFEVLLLIAKQSRLSVKSELHYCTVFSGEISILRKTTAIYSISYYMYCKIKSVCEFEFYSADSNLNMDR